jgi:hypothetical protein
VYSVVDYFDEQVVGAAVRIPLAVRAEAYERLAAARLNAECPGDTAARPTGSTADGVDSRAEIAELAGGLGTELAAAIEASSAEVRESLEMRSGE